MKNYEKLRLVLIYALKYENIEEIRKMKDLLEKNGISEKSTNLIN